MDGDEEMRDRDPDGSVASDFVVIEFAGSRTDLGDQGEEYKKSSSGRIKAEDLWCPWGR